MRRILVANPKGGCGKSTLAVHLASWFARNDQIVYLGDMDRQQSSRHWLESRPSNISVIRHWETRDDDFKALPKNCDVAILDSPAGLHGKSLKSVLNEVEKIVVPVSSSRFDMLATMDFFEELANTKAVRKERVDIGVVGMRVDPRTHAYQQLLEFLSQFDLPVITCISQSQSYLNAVESSTTIFDKGTLTEAVANQWRPLLDWLVSRRC
ncbi:ParA family protein [Zoogloea sp.]|uniref:ParA family protein n=1 Tax=Zoogloea sp. TaxID=49181 RepID=UPI001AD06FEA|nr:ParA family protein [Zoogloea sp.]MBN8283628.1 ParA family protein [Zoogloea sp.]